MLTYDPYLSWQKFVQLEIATKHLDPLYPALVATGWDEAKLMRWCAGMIVYYNAGIASNCCDLQGDDWWKAIYGAYGTAKRPAERRHFRGDLGKHAIKMWYNMFGTPEKFIQGCMKSTFMKTLKAEVPQVGPYFSWKVCDYRESVLGYDVDWSGAEKHLTKLALKGLDVVFPSGSYEWKLQQVIDEISKYPDPVRGTRPCGVAEAETAACSFRYYFTHKDPIGHDIVNKRKSLEGYGENAEHLSRCIPKEPVDEDVKELL